MESPPSKPSRSWSSLWTARWHRSSKVVALLSLVLLIFCNLPGQAVLCPAFERFRLTKFEIEHGWPFTYLIRNDTLENTTKSQATRTIANCFALTDNCRQLKIGSLIWNACVVLLISLAVGAAFEIWRRQRLCVWHFHLRDCLAAMLFVALAVGWYVHLQRQYARQHREIENSEFRSNGIFVADVQPGGLTWLRLCLGQESMAFLDRPYFIVVRRQSGMKSLSKVPSARVVLIKYPKSTTEDLSELAKLPHLEYLILDGHTHEGPDRTHADLPSLPRVRSIDIQRIAFARRLDRLPALERIMGDLDEQAFREIRHLRNVRELCFSPDEDDDLAELDGVPNLSTLTLSLATVNSAALENISRCRNLTTLSFYSNPNHGKTKVDYRGIHHLAKLPHLKIENNDFITSDLKKVEAYYREVIRRYLEDGVSLFGIPPSNPREDTPEA